jgi:cell division protein FtsB
MTQLFPRLLKIVLPIVIITGLLAVFGERGLIKAYQMANERDGIRKRIEKLRRENQYLKGELAALGSDRRYIEDIARKELGFLREGETVYRFRDESRQ